MNLVVRPAAAHEVEEAFLWYESQRSGLGHAFLDTVEKLFLELRETPNRHPVVHRDTRRVHVARFPYGIFYRIVGQTVVVVACFHGMRDPRGWEGRR